MEATLIVKLALMLIFFLEVTIFGNFVSSLDCFRNKKIMDLAMTFSGTLFLSIAMIDVIPQAIENFNDYLTNDGEKEISSSLHQGKLPLTMIIAMTTFLIIMWLDKIMIGHSHDHEYEISFVAGPKKPDGVAGSVEMQQNNNHDEFQIVAPGSDRIEEKPLAEQAGQSKNINWRPFILQVGMSIHAYFQTLAVGLQGSTFSVLSLATAILVHKWAEGLTLGLLYKKEGFKKSTILIMIIMQGFVNVLGLLTGSILMGKGNFVMAFFMSMSAGTFLYISLAEVLQQQLKQFTKGKMIMVVLANVFIAAIVQLEKIEDSNSQKGV